MWKRTGPQVVSQNIEGEVIAVDLQDGSYFSITGAGTVIWDCINNGRSRADILRCLEMAYNATPDTFCQSLDQFTEQLVGYKLIELDSDDKPDDNSVPATAQACEKTMFVPPKIERYTDMEDVLKMDPIHDFDEAGWPNIP